MHEQDDKNLKRIKNDKLRMSAVRHRVTLAINHVYLVISYIRQIMVYTIYNIVFNSIIKGYVLWNSQIVLGAGSLTGI